MSAEVEALGAPKTDTLARPPLELVVCQIQHEPKLEARSPATMLGIQSALGFGFDKSEPVTGGELTIAPNKAGQVVPQFSQTVGWRLTTSDGGWIVTLNGDSISLECTRYTTWTDFKVVLQRLISVVSETYHPELTQRVGVRYLDRIWRKDSTIPKEWDGLLAPGIVGLATDPLLADAVQVAQTYFEMDFRDCKANLRGSIAADQTPNKYSFLLDIDCFDERASAFSPETLTQRIDDLHLLNLRLFQAVITDRLYDEMLK